MRPKAYTRRKELQWLNYLRWYFRIAFRLSPSLCNSPRGFLFFSSSVSRSGEAFPLLRINPIISRGLMPVFEASESIVSTFPALILVLILVVLDSVSPSVLNPSRRKCRNMKKGKSWILFYYTSLWSSFSDNDSLLSVWSRLTCWLTRGEDWVCFLFIFNCSCCALCGWCTYTSWWILHNGRSSIIWWLTLHT